MRVLHVIDSLAPGGAERMVVELANAFNIEDVRAGICVTRSDTTLAQAVRRGIPVCSLGRRRTWDLAGFRNLGVLVRDGEYDVLHAHGYSSANFAAIALALNALSQPLLVHGHDSAPPPPSSRIIAPKRFSHFIGVAPEIAAWGRTVLGLPTERVSMLGNAINPVPYESAAPVLTRSLFARPPRLVGIVIANVRPVKQLHLLIRAIARASRREDIGLLVAGSLQDAAYVNYCQGLVTELGLGDRIVFCGSRLDLPELLAGSDFGLLSSARESGPLALLEYMAAGLPFSATRVGNIAHVAAENGIDGLVNGNDEANLALEIDKLLELSPSARQARGELGRQLMHQHFDIRVRALELGALYQRVVAARERVHQTRRRPLRPSR